MGRVSGNILYQVFIADCKINLTILTIEAQTETETLIAYVNRFKKKALGYDKIIDDKKLMQFCIKRMQKKFKIHIENHIILTFVDLTEKVENTKNTFFKIHKANQEKQSMIKS